MKVVDNDRFSVYIYELDHPPPHCHVRFADGSELCVTIPLVEPMYGMTITREIKNEIERNLDVLVNKWDELHPKRRNTVKKEKYQKKKKIT